MSTILPIQHPTEKRPLRSGDQIEIARTGAFPGAVHVFEAESIDALHCALAARRPLLVRGEPGTGKSQLAYATAAALRWPVRSKVVDARTESRDLLYEFDVVERLGAAQTLGATRLTREEIREELHPSKFVKPGPLWWAFDWTSAARKAGGDADPEDPPMGCVLLIDEIDKGDADVPNGLLECLGQGEFTPPGEAKPIAADDRPFLVIITTNEEKTLPAPFQRRCVVLHLDLPDQPDKLIETLCERAKAHFKASFEAVRFEAAQLLIEHRNAAKRAGLPRPGQAEYLDLIRAVTTLGQAESIDEEEQVKLVRRLRRFTYDKNPREESP